MASEHRRELYSPASPEARELTDPAQAYAGYRLLPGLVQKHVLRGAWAVEVEADSGERVRAGVQEQGVAFLGTFAS